MSLNIDQIKTLVILPHLDDEFALAPLIKKITSIDSKNIKFIFCSERLDSNKYKLLKRRKENMLSLNFLGVDPKSIFYLNDYFRVEDLKLYLAKDKIYNFLSKFRKSFKFIRIFTLTCEGGNPDHDFLALIVSKFSKQHKIKCFYFPAYNYENSFLLPIKVLSVLNTQKKFFKNFYIGRFCWIISLKIALIYKSEAFAFIKLLPFLILQALTSNSICYSNDIFPNKVYWQKSLTFKRYRFNLEHLNNYIIES